MNSQQPRSISITGIQEQVPYLFYRSIKKGSLVKALLLVIRSLKEYCQLKKGFNSKHLTPESSSE